MRKCCFCKDRDARAGQRDCQPCHTLKNREYREANRRRMRLLEKKVSELSQRLKA